MIQIIAGKKGSGKTKRLIDMTNAAAHESDHDVLFLDDDNRYMFDIDHKVRFINAGEYLHPIHDKYEQVQAAEMFLGFICGMLSQNFDVGTIFIDAFAKLCKPDLGDAQWLFEVLEGLSERNHVNFVISLSADPATLPEFLNKYVI